MITIYTSESVTRGHPDKFCDAVSDEILDECLYNDKHCRVACETFATKEYIVVGGEISTSAKIDYKAIVNKVAKNIGYDISNTKIEVAVHEQSPDISNAVDGEKQGAGDQGIMIGYACDETDEMLPIEYAFARKLTNRLEEVREKKVIYGIGADGKSQVSAKFVNNQFVSLTKIVISIQHDESKDISILRKEIREQVVNYVFHEFDLSDVEILINPSGRFVLGGIDADTGLTGRKIVVDAYGPRVPVGGGAFSGKDPSKVDRSGAYYARYVAKNIVAAGVANKVLIQLAYAIGKAEPIAVNIETFGSEKVEVNKIKEAVMSIFDFQPASIINQLNLLIPTYGDTVKNGHFGNQNYQWEKTDKASLLRSYLL